MTDETNDSPGKPTPEELAAEAAPPEGSAGLPDDVRDGEATVGDDEPDELDPDAETQGGTEP